MESGGIKRSRAFGAADKGPSQKPRTDGGDASFSAAGSDVSFSAMSNTAKGNWLTGVAASTGGSSWLSPSGLTGDKKARAKSPMAFSNISRTANLFSSVANKSLPSQDQPSWLDSGRALSSGASDWASTPVGTGAAGPADAVPDTVREAESAGAETGNAAAAAAPKSAGAEAAAGNAASPEKPAATTKPATASATPTKTGEEDEEVVFTTRAKLFRMVKRAAPAAPTAALGASTAPGINSSLTQPLAATEPATKAGEEEPVEPSETAAAPAAAAAAAATAEDGDGEEESKEDAAPSEQAAEPTPESAVVRGGPPTVRWQESGKGPLRVLRSVDEQQDTPAAPRVRIVMRQELSDGAGGRVLLNTLVWPGMKAEPTPGAEESMARISTVEQVASADGTGTTTEPRVYLVKFPKATHNTEGHTAVNDFVQLIQGFVDELAAAQADVAGASGEPGSPVPAGGDE